MEWTPTIHSEDPHEWKFAWRDWKLVQKIRKEGVMGEFKGRKYKYLYLGDGYKYWVVGRILNRVKVG